VNSSAANCRKGAVRVDSDAFSIILTNLMQIFHSWVAYIPCLVTFGGIEKALHH